MIVHSINATQFNRYHYVCSWQVFPTMIILLSPLGHCHRHWLLHKQGYLPWVHVHLLPYHWERTWGRCRHNNVLWGTQMAWTTGCNIHWYCMMTAFTDCTGQGQRIVYYCYYCYIHDCSVNQVYIHIIVPQLTQSVQYARQQHCYCHCWA